MSAATLPSIFHRALDQIFRTFLNLNRRVIAFYAHGASIILLRAILIKSVRAVYVFWRAISFARFMKNFRFELPYRHAVSIYRVIRHLFSAAICCPCAADGNGLSVQQPQGRAIPFNAARHFELPHGRRCTADKAQSPIAAKTALTRGTRSTFHLAYFPFCYSAGGRDMDQAVRVAGMRKLSAPDNLWLLASRLVSEAAIY